VENESGQGARRSRQPRASARKELDHAKKKPSLTSNAGAPVVDNQNTMTAGPRGPADAERDIRGFAMKFYTEDGNGDLVGNTTPVFFLRDPRTNLRSAKNQRHWVKFHFVCQQGIKNLNDTEAEAVVAKDRESNQRDLYESIEKGDFPTASVVPGIGFSPDKMLQGRLFSYADAQRYRLGVNHHLIPVNKARCPFHSYHRDGAMRIDGNHGSTLGYEPNSYGEWQQQPAFTEPPLALEGTDDKKTALRKHRSRARRRAARGQAAPPRQLS
jgi:catalase